MVESSVFISVASIRAPVIGRRLLMSCCEATGQTGAVEILRRSVEVTSSAQMASRRAASPACSAATWASISRARSRAFSALSAEHDLRVSALSGRIVQQDRQGPVLAHQVVGGAVPSFGRHAQQAGGQPERIGPLAVRHIRLGVAQHQAREFDEDRGNLRGHSLPITFSIARSWAFSSHQAE
jgi:hypothetical protein